MTLRIPTFAKLNLSLRVFQPRSDGYHPIDSIFQTVSLADELQITSTPGHGTIHLTTDHPTLPTDRRNHLVRLVEMFQKEIPFHLEVHLIKQIPIGGGLGGGSSNTAAFLNFLNHQCNWNYSPAECTAIALQLGSDIPFFLQGGRARVTGIGEQIEALSALTPPTHYLLICPPIQCDTKRVYHQFDQQSPPPNPSIYPANDLLPAALTAYPDLHTLHETLTAVCEPIHLSGSGSTFFHPITTAEEGNRLQTTLAPLCKEGTTFHIVHDTHITKKDIPNPLTRAKL